MSTIVETFRARFEHAGPVQIPAWALPLIMAKREHTYTRSGYRFDVEILTENLVGSNEGFADTVTARFTSDGRIFVQYQSPRIPADLDDTLTISVDYYGDDEALDLGELKRPVPTVIYE